MKWYSTCRFPNVSQEEVSLSLFPPLFTPHRLPTLNSDVIFSWLLQSFFCSFYPHPSCMNISCNIWYLPGPGTNHVCERATVCVKWTRFKWMWFCSCRNFQWKRKKKNLCSSRLSTNHSTLGLIITSQNKQIWWWHLVLMLMTLNGHSGSWDGVLITPCDKKKTLVALSGEKKKDLTFTGNKAAHLILIRCWMSGPECEPVHWKKKQKTNWRDILPYDYDY